MTIKTGPETARALLPSKSSVHRIAARRWWLWVLGAGVVGLGVFVLTRGHWGEKADVRKAAAPAGDRVVKVISPRQGGLERTSNQPGTIRGFDFAPLYAKVSGYLKALNVDRGDRVKAGQVLAEILDPELDAAVIQADAALGHSRAMVKQSEAKLRTVKAGVQAAQATLAQSRSLLEEAVAQRTYRKKALDRMTELARRNAVEQRLVDESEDQYMASLAAEHGKQSGIATAEAQLIEATAAVELAEADLETAKSEVVIAEANLKKAKVFIDYEKIIAPFDGVITYRGDGVHIGSFIRSATEGGVSQPLLTVTRTDRMRTIVELPDSDAPACDVGDPASVTIAALAGRTFQGNVSRISESENLLTRTMRVELDLPNPDGILRDGMFGTVIIQLEPPTKKLTIPSACLLERGENGKGAVFVVRDGKVERRPIGVGMDNGREAEVLEGLSKDDVVIAEVTSSLSEGLAVKADSAGADRAG
ncbi:efflux RND transporter periplasmic adaptor subunit [Aquisphaera insulae]|uniref:efflux RND transporter periplasmic adaptor subunit n=1 Tax=Aquisphaera insulae TaxID=2712864 RepID=UPI0013EAC53A|nr:efflux RND transporter periplasmic adaptor subunit [Aquisphaera insulae]